MGISHEIIYSISWSLQIVAWTNFVHVNLWQMMNCWLFNITVNKYTCNRLLPKWSRLDLHYKLYNVLLCEIHSCNRGVFEVTWHLQTMSVLPKPSILYSQHVLMPVSSMNVCTPCDFFSTVPASWNSWILNARVRGRHHGRLLMWGHGFITSLLQRLITFKQLFPHPMTVPDVIWRERPNCGVALHVDAVFSSLFVTRNSKAYCTALWNWQ